MRIIGFEIKPVKGDRPAFGTELAASVGARTSRSSDGLDQILKAIDGLDHDKAIDTIFRHIDYGHRSIADMVTVPIFMEGISQACAQLLWNMCQAVSGQESSTRFLNRLTDWTPVNGPTDEFTQISLKFYDQASEKWRAYFESNPQETDLPNVAEMDPKVKNRMLRNLVLDRARVFIPMAARTNVFMIQSSREWARIIKFLRSSQYDEFRKLGLELQKELEHLAPRMVRYCAPNENSALIMAKRQNRNTEWDTYDISYGTPDAEMEFLRYVTPEELVELKELAATRENRYDDFDLPGMIPVTMKWFQAPIGEIRDLHRHRPGRRVIGRRRTGTFMGCLNKLHPMAGEMAELYRAWREETRPHLEAIKGTPYSEIFGSCFEYSHHTDFGHAVYLMEIRSGLGGHFKYVDMMRSIWRRLGRDYKEMVNIGIGEIEV